MATETFTEFQQMSATRAKKVFPPQCMTPEFLAVVIAGEAGEMCNIVKKVMRGDFNETAKREEILDELADIITYCDLFMSYFGEDTGDRVMKKFAEVSQRRNYILG